MSEFNEKMIKYKAEMASIFHYLLHGAYPPGCSETNKRNVRRQRNNYKIEENRLYRKRVRQGDWVKVVTSAAEVIDLLKTHHQIVGGHCGIGNTKVRISEKYYWHGMLEDIKEYISTCPTCQVLKKNQTQAPALKQIKVYKPLEIVGIDIIGGLPKTRSGNQYILNMIDYFTKHVWLFALPRKDGTGAHICIQQYTNTLGAPKRIISDQGREFCNKINQDFSKTKGIKRCVISPYHPEANGLVERSNGSVRMMLSKLMVDCGPNWDKTLHSINEDINSQQQASTKFTPFFLMFGRKPHTVTEIEEVGSDVELLEESPEEFVEERQEILGKVYEEIDNDPLLRDISTDTATTGRGNLSRSRRDTPTIDGWSLMTTTEHKSTCNHPSTPNKNISTKGIKRECEDADSVLQETVQQLRAMSSAEEVTDVYSNFGNVVAHDLRQMSEESRIYAQRFISEILFLGKLGNLSASTMIVK